MKSEPMTITFILRTEKEAKEFLLHAVHHPPLLSAYEAVKTELRRRKAKKNALVVERQGDTFMLKRDWE